MKLIFKALYLVVIMPCFIFGIVLGIAFVGLIGGAKVGASFIDNFVK